MRNHKMTELLFFDLQLELRGRDENFKFKPRLLIKHMHEILGLCANKETISPHAKNTVNTIAVIRVCFLFSFTQAFAFPNGEPAKEDVDKYIFPILSENPKKKLFK